MTDETTRATSVITHILERSPHAAPAVLANEIIQALHAHGWRPTAAHPPPDWRGHTRPASDETRARFAAQARAAITRSPHD